MDDMSRRGRFQRFITNNPPRDAFAEAWGEHRAYVGTAVGLFAVGMLIGIALYLAGVDLLEFVLELFEESIFPEDNGAEDIDIDARFFIVHNSVPFLVAIFGAITLGLVTAWVMVFNGIILGNVGVSMGQSAGYDFVIVGILPHGIFELPALFIAAGVGFRLLHRFIQRIRGTREAFITKIYLYRTTILVAFGWGLLVVAAFIEAYITPELLELFFADRLG